MDCGLHKGELSNKGVSAEMTSDWREWKKKIMMPTSHNRDKGRKMMMSTYIVRPYEPNPPDPTLGFPV